MELEEKLGKAEKTLEEGPKPVKDFDDILDVIGGFGRYQKTLLFGMLTTLCLIFPHVMSNAVFMLSVPDHWCHVPGRPNDTDLETWKNWTLPLEGDEGEKTFSQCEMFSSLDEASRTIVKCDEWEYDTKNYDRTLPTEHNWVCDKDHYVANAFSISGAGTTVGTIVLGVVVDRFGRKSTYFSALFCFVIFSASRLFIASNITVFLVLQFFAGFSMCLIYVTPIMIAIELLGKEHRAWVYSITSMTYVIGNSLLPLFAYLLRSWLYIGLMTPLTSALVLVYYKFLPESPRWLLSVGRVDDALKIVEEIAKTNGHSTSDKKEELRQVFKAIAAENEVIKKDPFKKRILDLFSSRTLVTRTILLSTANAVNMVVFGGILLNITSMAGNEFLNYFLLAIIDLPTGYTAGLLASRFGRRWTKTVLFFVVAAVFAIAGIFVSGDSWINVATVMAGKFVLSVNTIIAGLHESENFPTQLRSTGTSLVATVGSAFAFSSAYIVQLGKTNEAAPYIIFTAVSLVGAVTSPLLPETAGRKLPETVEDAQNFGKDDKFWSYLPKN